MKKFLMPAAALLLLSSCEGGWSDEYKTSFRQTCLTGSMAGQLPDDQREPYCECALEKTMQHYKTISEVVENKDSTRMSADLKQCFENTVRK